MKPPMQRSLIWAAHKSSIPRSILCPYYASQVCLYKRKGGLGVKHLSTLNKALLSKWNWHFAIENGAFWNHVINGKKKWGIVSSRIPFLVGNRRRVKFWKDKWKGGWSPYFSRPLNNWEVGSVERFLSCLDGLRVHRDEEDRALWTKTKNGKFTVMSLYTALELGKSISFPWSNIWKTWAQPRVGFVAWEATWRKVFTLDQDQKMGRSLVNRCFLSF
ncbi:hypothetical protein CK203_014944 [Vitis vinifera]|uniref:Reverse transcriptase zinc-binding domain-containing protein n=1 Tax=Vitis vinifera TaxID=29760 RepID=A0A438BNQ2_VITVI|nr:hypothetical protein CK203_114466 [Vitis vinifera]RVX06715.1 hypothetical protein CK203_014944 [Vitis vinifera]